MQSDKVLPAAQLQVLTLLVLLVQKYQNLRPIHMQPAAHEPRLQEISDEVHPGYLLYWYKSTNTDVEIADEPRAAEPSGEEARFREEGDGGTEETERQKIAWLVLSLLALLVQKYKY